MLGAELSIADAVRTTRPVDGVTLWLLGDAGVLLVEASGWRIAIDPWTSPWLEVPAGGRGARGGHRAWFG